MRFACLFAALPFLLPSPALAQAVAKAQSSIEIGPGGEGVQARIVNRDFLFDSRLSYGAEHPTRLMLEMTTDTTQRDDAEGLTAATVGVKVSRIVAGALQPLWSGQESGDRGAVSHDQPVFIVRQSGCCGARDSFSVFNLYSGRRLFTATPQDPAEPWVCWATLDVPNSGGLERLIAFHAAYSATDDKAFQGRRDVVGLLTYAAPDKPLARYRLIATAGSVDDFMGQATLALKRKDKSESALALTLWSADGKKDPKAIGGFAILLRLTDDQLVEIPVEGDGLVLAEARLPPGLRIEAAPLP